MRMHYAEIPFPARRLSDLWTSTLDPNEYVAFLLGLLNKMKAAGLGANPLPKAPAASVSSPASFNNSGTFYNSERRRSRARSLTLDHSVFRKALLRDAVTTTVNAPEPDALPMPKLLQRTRCEQPLDEPAATSDFKEPHVQSSSHSGAPLRTELLEVVSPPCSEATRGPEDGPISGANEGLPHEPANADAKALGAAAPRCARRTVSSSSTPVDNAEAVGESTSDAALQPASASPPEQCRSGVLEGSAGSSRATAQFATPTSVSAREPRTQAGPWAQPSTLRVGQLTCRPARIRGGEDSRILEEKPMANHHAAPSLAGGAPCKVDRRIRLQPIRQAESGSLAPRTYALNQAWPSGRSDEQSFSYYGQLPLRHAGGGGSLPRKEHTTRNSVRAPDNNSRLLDELRSIQGRLTGASVS